MRLLATALSYLTALILVSLLASVVALLLAGPHSELLPAWAGQWVIPLAWLAVLLLPAWVAALIWRWLGRRMAAALGAAEKTRQGPRRGRRPSRCAPVADLREQAGAGLA